MSNNFKDDFEKSSIDRHKFTSRPYGRCRKDQSELEHQDTTEEYGATVPTKKCPKKKRRVI